MSNRQRVQSLVRQVLEQVDALTPHAMREIVPVLQAARRELERGVSEWMRRGPGADAAFTPKHMRLALAQIRAAEEALLRLTPAMRAALERGGREAARLARRWTGEELTRFARMFEGEGLPPINLPTVDHLLHENRWLITQYDSSARRYGTRQRLWLRRQFAIGVIKQETVDQLTRRIAGISIRADLSPNAISRGVANRMFGVAYSDAERIVRTELNNAYNAHHQTSIEAIAQDTPGVMKRWDATGDWRLCPLCRELDAQTIQPNESFRGGYMQPPRHPNCFAPDTQIAGEIVGASKARYAGPMITITMSDGRRLSVTPNHPILTTHGFVPAGHIDYRSQVLCDSSEISTLPRSGSIAIDEYNDPAAAEQVFDFLVKRYASISTPTTTGDFHGDALGFEGQINIVDMSRKLECCHVWNHLGQLSDVESAWRFGGFDSYCPAALFSEWHDPAPSGRVRTDDLGFALLSSHARPFDTLRLGLIAELNSHACKPQADDIARNAEFARELVYRTAGQIRPCDVRKVERLDFDGHVFDFQSTGGWLSANGVIASNCRCVLIAWMNDWPEVGPTPRQRARTRAIERAERARHEALRT